MGLRWGVPYVSSSPCILYRQAAHVRGDPDLEALRAHPKYAAVLAEIEENAASGGAAAAAQQQQQQMAMQQLAMMQMMGGGGVPGQAAMSPQAQAQMQQMAMLQMMMGTRRFG